MLLLFLLALSGLLLLLLLLPLLLLLLLGSMLLYALGDWGSRRRGGFGRQAPTTALPTTTPTPTPPPAAIDDLRDTTIREPLASLAARMVPLSIAVALQAAARAKEKSKR